MKHGLEPILGIEAFGYVVNDERQAVGLAPVIIHCDVANLVDPTRRICAQRRDFDDQIRESFTRQKPHKRILAVGKATMVAVAQAEALDISVRSLA